MDKPTFIYVTYIATTLEQLWEELTSESFTKQYWEDGQLQSDWQVGSSVQQVNQDGESVDIGEVLQSEPPYRLSYTFQTSDVSEAQPSRVRFELEQSGATVKLTLIHHRLNPQSCMTMGHRWTASLSYLKQLLETKEDLLRLVA